MAREIRGEGCEFRGTKYCDMLNMQSCGNCAAYGKDPDERARMQADLDVLGELLPEGGVSHLFLSEECLFCKGEAPGKRACYAMVDMAHREPRREKRSAIGIKVKSTVGSLIPVQAACCAGCRKRFRILEYLPVALPLAVAVILLVLVNIEAVSEALRGAAVYLPAALFLGGTALAYAAGKIAAKRLQRAYGERMHLDVMELPTLRTMREGGWFPITQDRRGRVRPVFLKQRLAQGVCTGAPWEGEAEETAVPSEEKI